MLRADSFGSVQHCKVSCLGRITNTSYLHFICMCNKLKRHICLQCVLNDSANSHGEKNPRFFPSFFSIWMLCGFGSSFDFMLIVPLEGESHPICAMVLRRTKFHPGFILEEIFILHQTDRIMKGPCLILIVCCLCFKDSLPRPPASIILGTA